MLARIAKVISTATATVTAARLEQLRVEMSPVWNGETRTITVSVPALDENGKAVRDMTADPTIYPKGKVVRVSEERVVPLTIQSRYEKATRNRRNAARRILAAERKFALVASEMPTEEVVASLRKIYG